MSVQSVLLPVFVYVALAFGLLGGLILAGALARRSGMGAGGAMSRGGRARTAGLVSASYSNQFELPVLFFALVALSLLTHRADGVFVVLEWLFVLARFVHAGIDVTVNVIAWRGAAFATGAAILSIAWIRFAVAILAG